MAILKDLIVHGSSRFLNKIYASEIQTPLIDAEAGIFKKLKADDATVVGLLDVQGQMHTNSWTNSNIATIDGSFYIAPTLSSSSGTVSFSSATAATFTGTYSAVSSLYIGNDTASTVQWTSGSKILITGEIDVDGEWTPLGTLLGTLNSTNPTTSMPVVSITDNRNNTSNILTNIYSLKSNASLSYRNLKVSLYQRADSSEYYPLGIFMTALGQNGKTFFDIYGGVNELTTSYGGYANPNVRIGNLSGLPAITTAAGNFTPVGWGIYTTNGYFSGTIVSNTGVIGGWKLGASSLYNGTTGLNNNTEGIYLGTDGIRNYKDTNTYVNIVQGVIKARGVNLTGQITATSGTIGGATIENGVLKIANINITGTINGNHIDASSINIGDLNGVSNYALKTEVTDAEKVATSYITYIDSTEGIKIHNVSDQTNYLKLNSSAISMYRNNVETLNINNNEVRIGKNSGNNVYIDNDSIDIKNGQTILATFGEAMQIGQNNKNHASINPLSFKLIDKEGNTYFHASDLRESQDGTVEIIDTFISDGSNPAHSTDDGGYVSTLKTYSLSFPATDTNYTVEVSDSSGEGLSKAHYFISFTRNANEGAIITVTYETSSYLVKAYTLGFRLENSKIGALSCGIGDHITASGISSYAEGYRTIASGRDSHAEGASTRASGDSSHAEGYQTTASRQFSHAEGYNSIASGGTSHAEGRETTASGSYSHAEGQGSIASGDISHAEGAGTIASSSYQHVQGKYNIEDPNNRYAFIIGNGRQEPNTIVRSNAFTIDWNGSIEAAGDITANNLSINNKIIVGSYNIEDTNNQYAFIVGNGTSSDERSNSFTVDWNGGICLTKPIYNGNFITCKDGNDTIKFRVGGDGGAEIGSNLIVKGNQVINGNLAIDGFMTVSSSTYSTIKYLNVGALTVNARKPFSLVRQTYTRTITANSRCYINQEYTPPTGYIPVGIVGWGTFNGTHADHCIIGHAYVWGGNPNTIDIYVWNQHPSESATNVVIYVDILYIADTFL